MKKLLPLILTLCLLLTAAHALTIYDYVTAAENANPDWMLYDETHYYKIGGVCVAVDLMQTDGCTLLLHEQRSSVDPYGDRDAIEWQAIDFPPLPMTEEAMQRLHTMEPEEICDADLGNEIADELLDGCALFLLEDGEHWEQLLIHDTNLVGLAINAQEQTRLVIAHWNGVEYDRIDSTKPQTVGLQINSRHSREGKLELMTDNDDLPEAYFSNDSGTWRMESISTNNGVFDLADDYMSDVNVGWQENNENWIYGECNIPQVLADLDLSMNRSVPLNEVVDTSAFACAARDGTPTFNAANGAQTGTFYAHVAGRIMAEEDDWVQLHIGERDAGFDAWFRRADLAFGDDVNRMLCGFPSFYVDYEHGQQYRDVVIQPIADVLGVDATELDDQIPMLWVIGRDTAGSWRVLMDNAQLVTVPANAYPSLAAPEHYLYIRNESDDDEDVYLTWDEFWNRNDEE